MNKYSVLRTFGLCMVVVLIASVMSIPAYAQDPDHEPFMEESNTFQLDTPVIEDPEILDTLPSLTEDQITQLEWGIENSHRHPEVDGGAAPDVSGPATGTESMLFEKRSRSGEPLLPGDAQTYIWTQFGSTIPGGYKSNVMESSTDGKSRRLFYTGNFFAASSMNKGKNWSYLSAFSGFPDFCCDQVIIHDISRDIYLWLRMGAPDGNGENVFKLSVAFAAPFNTSYWTYTIAPTDINPGWTNEWWDYPHMQLGANYLYLSWNMFNQTGTWTQTVMLRVALDNLAAAGPFSGNYHAQSDWFTFVPVSGSQHTMYYASNWESPPYDKLKIYRWDEDSTSIYTWTKTVAAWTPTGRGDMHCGTPNWLARGDMRLLTGARYSIYSDGIAEDRQPGRKVLAWWWNVAEGGGFANPYIDAAAFYEDTMVQLPGYLGQPYFWGSTDYCIAYPSIVPNARGDLGAIFNFSDSSAFQKPKVGYSLADDYIGAPPGWLFFGAAASGAGPSDSQWGDYNTVRAYQGGTTWIAGAHYIPGTSNCSNCAVPLWFSFGRERDGANFRYW